MKKQLVKTVSALFLAMLFVLPGTAQEKKSKAKAVKELSKSYTISDGFLLGIDTKYGSIDIVNWEKDELSVEVTIEAISASKEKAEKALKEVKINIDESKKEVYFETDYDGKNIPEKTHIEVSYKVNAPKYLNVMLEQKYGSVYIQELTGNVMAEVKYGSFDAKALLNDRKESPNLLDIAYGNLEIEKASVLVCEMSYGHLAIDEVAKLELESKYSKLRVGTVEVFTLESKYDQMNIDQLLGSLDIESAYTKVNIEKIAKDFEAISASMTYGNLNGGLEKGAGFKVNASTVYGKISIPEGDLKLTKNEQSEHVEGSVGDAKSLVNVDLRYGSLNLK